MVNHHVSPPFGEYIYIYIYVFFFSPDHPTSKSKVGFYNMCFDVRETDSKNALKVWIGEKIPLPTTNRKNACQNIGRNKTSPEKEASERFPEHQIELSRHP